MGTFMYEWVYGNNIFIKTYMGENIAMPKQNLYASLTFLLRPCVAHITQHKNSDLFNRHV